MSHYQASMSSKENGSDAITSNDAKHGHDGYAALCVDDQFLVRQVDFALREVCMQYGDVSQQRRHLLVFDGHASHVFVDMVQAADRQGIDFLILPSYTLHVMQPLDVCMLKPFKVAFIAYCDHSTLRCVWLFAKKEILAQWISLALRRALIIPIIKKGFWVIGIWPWDYTAMAAQMGSSQVYHRREASDLVDEVVDAFT